MSAAAPRSRAVLVVEDEPMTRIFAADAITDAGITTYEAADCAEALQEIHDHPNIRLIFTDFNMSGEMDGLALAEKVCSADPGMRLIVTSGAVHLEDEQLPSDGTFLRKPYSRSGCFKLSLKSFVYEFQQRSERRSGLAEGRRIDAAEKLANH